MKRILNKKFSVCFIHSLAIECYKTILDVVCRFYSVVLCTVTRPSNNIFCIAAFAGVFDDFFD